MRQLFENIEGNRFRLIIENVNSPQGSDLVRSGLEKVFASGGTQIPYRRVENVGLGYIKSVSEAIKCALQESRQLAPKYGYVDNEAGEAFVKEHGEGDMSNPEEKREVQIAKKILSYAQLLKKYLKDDEGSGKFASANAIEGYAQELIDLHTGKAVTKPGTDGASYKPGSVY